MAANPDPLAGKRLDSWKEIAAFLGRAERTVKRWETERGLPVHRLPGGGRSAVFAYSKELADWLRGRSEDLDGDDKASGETAERRSDEHRSDERRVGELRPDERQNVELRSGEPGNATPQVIPVAATSIERPSSKARFAAWLIPLTLAAGFVIYFSAGQRNLHFKAMASRHAPNAEAQDLYLKGRYFWDRRTPDDLNKAIDYFTQAIVKDPSDAQAYVGLADCYNLLREFGSMPPSEAYPRAISAAERAIELDDTSAEAHISLAFGTYWWSWKGATAEREFKRALELDPKSVRAHHWYATYLLGMNRYPEAIDQIEQARRLNPSSNAILADKGLLLWQAGHGSESVALLTQLESTEPTLSSTHAYLGKIYWDQRNYAKALPEIKRAAELRHDENGLRLTEAGEKGFAAGGLEGLYESELPIQQDLVERGSGSAFALAATYAALGKKQEALACLQGSFDRHEAAMLMRDPIPELQNEPQYQNFRNQVAQLLIQ